MTRNYSSRRRKILSAACGALATATLAPLRIHAQDQVDRAIRPIAPELTLFSGFGGNVLALATADGLVVVDSGLVSHADSLMSALAEIDGTASIHTLVNTHWHREQVGANALIGKRGAAIVAHEKTRQHLANKYYLPDEDRYMPAFPKDALPGATFYSKDTMTIGDHQLDLGYLLEAHTDGDAYIYFRDLDIVAVGDAVSPQRDPELDWFGGGWIGGRVDALAELLQMTGPATQFVPSYGPVVGRAEVQAEHDMMVILFERMVEWIRQGMSVEDIIEAGVMDGLQRSFTDPYRFVFAAHKSLWAHHNTLSHDIV